MMPTETLRAMLDERGVDWDYGITGSTTTRLSVNGVDLTFTPRRDGLMCSTILTPEQAIAATLGLGTWVSPTWERWHKSLRHDEVNSIGDAVEQLMYEVIEFGGDMGPNGNTYNGIDEGDVLTSGYINEWVERFKNMLEPGTCKPATYDNGDSTDHLEPGEYHEFWEPACKCSVCGSLIPLRNYCPNCGAKVVD